MVNNHSFILLDIYLMGIRAHHYNHCGALRLPTVTYILAPIYAFFLLINL